MKIKTSKITVGFILFILFFLLFIILYINIKGILLNCFHATDFGIYQQAIYDIAAKLDFNPYISVRNVKIFNDHFDPILILASPIVRLFSYNPVSLIVFEFSWLIITLAFIWKSVECINERILFILMIILTKGILTGFGFPIHPTTWSILPALILSKKVIENDFKWTLFLSIVLMLFKEVFAFGIVGLSGFYLFKKNYKEFGLLFSVALVNIVFVYLLRPIFFGEIVSYSSWVLGGGLPTIIKNLMDVDVKAFLKVFYPFFIPIFLILRERVKANNYLSDELGVLFYFIPIFLIHWLTNRVHFQYGILLVTPLLGLIFFSKINRVWIGNKRILFSVVILFALSSLGTHSKNIKAVFNSKKKSCSFTSARLSSIKNIDTKLTANSGTILSTGGAIPSFLKPSMSVYQAGLFKNINEYDYLLIEKSGTGNHYPFTPSEIDQIVFGCSSEDKVIDDNWFILIEKPSQNCTNLLKKNL